MAYRLQVGNTTGALLAELEPNIRQVSWRLNDVGKMVFEIAKGNEKATEEILRYGNKVLVEFDNGLPNWVGMIDPPRDWNRGIITVTAYSGEYILGTRQTDRGRYFSDASVGYIFGQLIEEANAVESMGVELGNVYEGGDGHYPDYHYDNLLKIIRDSLCSRLSDTDWDVTGSVSGGRIVMQANLYERKGSDKSGSVLLAEGHNLTDIKMTEQGEIVNWWDLAGEGSTWGEDRLRSEGVSDDGSRSTYGLRQGSAVYASVSTQTTLDSHASTKLAESKNPHNMFEFSAVDEDPAGFEAYDVGDEVACELPGYGFGGFEGSVQVLGREWDGVGCKLVVREA